MRKIDDEDGLEFLKSSNLDGLKKRISEFENKGYSLVCVRTDERNSSHFGKYTFYTAIMKKK